MNKNKGAKNIRKALLFLLDGLVMKRYLERGETSGRLLRVEELDDDRNLQHNFEYEIRIYPNLHYVTSFGFQNNNMFSRLISIEYRLLGV